MGKTKKVMAGISSTVLMLGLVGCGSDYESQDIPSVPQDTGCTDWEWDMDDGVWECDDNSSGYYGHYYYGGRYYKNKTALHNSNDFISYKNSSSFKGSSGTSNSSINKSSGFGSGSKSFGG